MELNINVKVCIGVEDRLAQVLAALIGGGGRALTAPTVIDDRPTEAQAPAVSEEMSKPSEVEAVKQTEVENKVPLQLSIDVEAAAEQPTKSAPEPVAEQPKEYTEVDVRAAMDRTRKRIEGADYKDNPSGEGYKRWHKVLTSWFKEQSAFCSGGAADKPSALSDSESRRQFIALCDEVQVENDKLTLDTPF